MFQQSIETSPNPRVTVCESLANLVVRGSEEDRLTVRVQGAAEDAALEREGETFTLAARANCTLTCPPTTTLTIHAVHGNLKVEGLEGHVSVGTAHGNADLRAVGPVSVQQAFGNLRIRQVMGDLRVQTAGANARVYDVQGACSVSRVDGNLLAEELRGGLAAEHVRGNSRLGPPFSPGQTYQLHADGNLTLHLPPDASLCLALGAHGQMRSNIPGLVLEDMDGWAEGVLGAGEASIEAQVGGNIHLRPLEPGEGMAYEAPFNFVPGLEGLGAKIEARVADAVAQAEARLEEEWGRVDGAEIRRRAEQAAEQARMRAERADRRWKRATGRRARHEPASATAEERMRVLRLVEEGKITPQQAADLLAALEGR